MKPWRALIIKWLVKPEVWPGPACPSCGNAFYFDYDGRVFCSMCGEEGTHVHNKAVA
jgi:predicted amidophosphoribosyltransferase